mgnify:CR=1 FL=1
MLSNLQVCFNAVMPLFLIMGLGYGVKCLGGIRVEDVPGLNKMAFRFFMPVMLFYNIYRHMGMGMSMNLICNLG